MHTAKNTLLVGLLLTTAIAAAVIWRQHLELVALRAAALDTRERADWQRRLWAAEKRSTDLEQQLAKLPAPLPDAPPESGPSDDLISPTTARTASRGAGINRFAAMMEQPEVQRLFALQHKAALDGRYADLFKRLGLTPAQLDQFKNLLVEKTTAAADVLMAAREQGINPRRDRDAVQQLVADSQADIDESIRALLGESGFTQFKQYEQTMPQRAVVDQLEQRLSYSSTPLSSEQGDALVRLLATHTNGSGGAFPPTAGAIAGGPGGVIAPLTGARPAGISEAAISQAGGILAAPQLEALRQLQQEQQAQAELAAAFRNQRSPTRAPSTGTASAPPPPPGG